ncbi:hypothetical protein [Salinarchaeum laminariae]|uniref:hypothetical protein n=1 Tax=Salinarchaeum laminariae TaxID=869888 RepID=UPI0020BFDBFE|nr:hypothetical protein [Salinarchaeum laminariae]
MDEQPVCVVDTNALVNLATPVVDRRPVAPTGEDPLRALLRAYDVHVPASVPRELATMTGDDKLLSAAASLVLQVSHRLNVEDVRDQFDESLENGLDRVESECIWLANDRSADCFVTDEFNTSNYLFVDVMLNERNSLFTTPHILCSLANNEILSTEYVDMLLTYFTESKHWDEQYTALLRSHHLHDSYWSLGSRIRE